MTGKELKILLYCFIISVAVCSAFYWMQYNNVKKTAVVDAVKLFNSYNMKKDLEGRVKTKLQSIGRTMDSLENALKLNQVSKDENEQKLLVNQYQMAKMQLDNEYTKSNQEINEEIWKRLNPLIDEYGKSKNLHLIIGANGMGSVLYNDGYYDLTDDVIGYVNKKYEKVN